MTAKTYLKHTYRPTYPYDSNDIIDTSDISDSRDISDTSDTSGTSLVRVVTKKTFLPRNFVFLKTSFTNKMFTICLATNFLGKKLHITKLNNQIVIKI